MLDIPKENTRETQLPEWLPVVPLNNAVLFPGATAPIAVTSETAGQAIEVAAKRNRFFAAVSLRESSEDIDEDAEDFKNYYRVGTVAFIVRMMRSSEDGTQLVVRGVQKVRIKRLEMKEEVPYAKIEAIEEEPESSTTIEALQRQIVELTEQMIERAPMLPNELQGMPSSIENPHRLVYFVLSLTRADMHRLQEIYETEGLEEKLRRTYQELSHEMEIIELGGKIQDEIQTRMSKTEKEFYLREQLKAIRKELGESDEGDQELDELEERIETTAMPLAVKEKAENELNRLRKLNPASPEYPIAHNYLDWLLTYPWTQETEDQLDIKEAEKILNEDHYGLKEVKERIIEYLAVRSLNQNMKGPILCFVGPPGVGKTSLGQSIAHALGRHFVRMSLGGVHDEAEIRGHRRTYIGAMPGTIVQHIKRAESCNPVFMLDEIDKVGQDFRGDPSSALLEVLDPAQNYAFRDHYMEVDIDLSKVLFIATANMPDRIQPALRDRMEEIRIAGYTIQEKEQIALRYLIPKAEQENGLRPGDIAFATGVLSYLIRYYTQEAGVRNLERTMHAMARKIAVRRLNKQWRKRKINKQLIKDFLGSEPYQHEVARRTSRPGVATGLAWTPVGGEILFVEAMPVPGSKGLLLTGKLGDVMKESARAAISLVRSSSRKLGVKNEFFKNNELHLHVPAGAVPKDGPSAGVAMVAAVASAALKKPVRKDMAMTGEITLTGLVLPVGGIKEKVLGAHRAGIHHVILPSRNEKDLEEIDPQVRQEMTFHFVDNVNQALELCLLDSKPPSPTKSQTSRAAKRHSKKSGEASRHFNAVPSTQN